MCSAAKPVSRRGALEVHADGLVEKVAGHPGKRGRHGGDTRVVDQYVDAAERLDRLVDQGRTGVPIPYVAGDGEAAPAEQVDLVCDWLARLELAATDHDVGAGLGEAECHGPPEALARAGDDDDLAVRPERRDGHAPSETIWSALASRRSA
jgi:hypothetical protein